MLPFEPNQHQLKALQNGSTKLWIPLPKDITDVSYENGMLTQTQYEEIKTDYIKYSQLQPGKQYFCTTDIHCIFTVTDVEVKQVQKLRSAEVYALNYRLRNFRAYHVDSLIFEQVYDSQYPEQLYSSKPYGFLIAIQLKEK